MPNVQDAVSAPDQGRAALDLQTAWVTATHSIELVGQRI
jgi:hypothetical protein